MEAKKPWYLVRTKAGQEHRARAQLRDVAHDVVLPLIKIRVRRWGRLVESTVPLFPTYLIAQVDLQREWYVRYTRGVRGLVRFGADVAVVPEWVVRELMERCECGPLELPRRALSAGGRVTVIDGPFRDFEGIFEHYLSGAERVAILLHTMGREAQAVLPARIVVSADG